MAKFTLDHSREQNRLDERTADLHRFGSGALTPWYNRDASGFLSFMAIMALIGSAFIILACLKG